jgi:outer membrane protein assembly factor BamB
MLCVGSNDNNLYALDTENGLLKWYFSGNAAIHTQPIFYGKYLFFGSDDGRIYAVDRVDGTYMWSFAPEDKIDLDLFNYITTPISSQPIIDDGVMYIGVNGTIYGLDVQTTEKISSASEKDIEVPIETWFFIVITLIFVIVLTIIYLYISKKRAKWTP